MAAGLGWYKPPLQASLPWIRELELSIHAPIIDVGGGASTLVDDLLNDGCRCITILGLSENALSSVTTRLGEKANVVTWPIGDVTLLELPKPIATNCGMTVPYFIFSPSPVNGSNTGTTS